MFPDKTQNLVLLLCIKAGAITVIHTGTFCPDNLSLPSHMWYFPSQNPCMKNQKRRTEKEKISHGLFFCGTEGERR